MGRCIFLVYIASTETKSCDIYLSIIPNNSIIPIKYDNIGTENRLLGSLPGTMDKTLLTYPSLAPIASTIYPGASEPFTLKIRNGID